MSQPSEHEALIVRLCSAVLANAEPRPDGTINFNFTVAREMVEKVLAEFQVIQIKRGGRK